NLPTTFLVNAKGEIVKVYESAAAAQVVQDVAKIEVPAADRLLRAIPFPGTFYATLSDRNYFQYGLEVSEQGCGNAAPSAYGSAANKLAHVLGGPGKTHQPLTVLQRLVKANPGFEMGYVTLCRMSLNAAHRQEAVQILEHLLQRNPPQPAALQLLREIKSGG